MQFNHFRLKKKAAFAMRLLVFVVTIPSLVAGSFPAPAHAAVPTWVVQFDANTAFETSLETFIFDLFNTLQRRQEDFTAAFELQKIEKAREDVNKLFQETQEELQNFGLALEQTKNPGDGPIRDPRLNAGQNNDNCKSGLYSGDNAGCPPVISPLKDSRIIHDPYQYLFGDAYTKAQLFTYCFFDYLIWDQAALLPQIYGSLQGKAPYTVKKSTYAVEQRTVQGLSPNQQSIEWLKATRNGIVAQLHSNNYYLLNYPLYNIYGIVGQNIDQNQNPIPDSWDMTVVKATEAKCRQVMYAVGANSPATVEQNVQFLRALNVRSALSPLFSPDLDALRKQFTFLPTLERGIAGRDPGDGYTIAEAEQVTDARNSRTGIAQTAGDAINSIIQETTEERKATYIAGQGFRPEYLYTTQNGANLPASQDPQGAIKNSSFQLNTEYIISPAAVLLQKMQAATQATFDLAGQGFLYLSPDNTDSTILAKYRLASTATQSAERRICNQAGSCALLDPWLKPAASFRTTAVFKPVDANQNGRIDGNETNVRGPVLIGVGDDFASPNRKPIAGSGLPAPWEDPADFLDISNEKSQQNFDRRYTIARFRIFNRDPQNPNDIRAATDEFDDATLGRPRKNFQDNIGRDIPGVDFPINDWYDRVLEMYESGIGVSQTGNSERNAKLRDFTVRDWQCYVATWFLRQDAHKAQNANFFVGDSGVTTDQSDLMSKYCGTQ